MSSGGKGNSRAQTSSSTTTSTSQETTNNVDSRAVQGDNAAIGGNVTLSGTQSGGPITISTTDQGAVAAGLDLALESLNTIKSLSASHESTLKDTTQNAFALADSARQSETSNAIQNTLKYGALIVALAIIAWAVVKSRNRS